MRKTKLALVLPFMIAVLAGCSSSDNRFEPVDPPEVNNLFKVETVWSRSTDGVGDFYSELVPAFADNKVYVASRDGEVEALNALDDGKRLWRKDLGKLPENKEKRSARLSGGLSVHGTNLVAGSENGFVYLLDTADGSVKWQVNLKAEVVARPVFNQSGDRIFVLDAEGNFTALDTLSGEKLWVTGDAPQALRLRAQATPTVIGDRYVLVGTSSGRVSVILQETGATVNLITVGETSGTNAFERLSDVAGSPLVLGNEMYAASFAGGLIDYDFGSYSYKSRLGYQSSRNFGFDDTSLLVTSDDGSVYCLNRFDNSQRWANTQLGYRNVTAPVVYGNYAVVGDYEGYIYFMDLADGSIDYMDDIDGSAIYAAPQVYNGHLYVLAADGSLYCLSLPDISDATQKELANNQALASAAQGISLNAPGVMDSGIYAPSAMDEEQLEARRAAIRKAVAQQEARIAAQRRAYEEQVRARKEYEARVKAYEQERREQLSGFGIASGIRAEMAEQERAEKDTKDKQQSLSC